MRSLLLIPVFAGALPLLAQTRPTPELLHDVIPANTTAEQFVLSADGRRTYYLNSTGEVWLSDRERNANVRVATGNPWDLSLAPTQDALAYTRSGDGQGDCYVWLMPLDP